MGVEEPTDEEFQGLNLKDLKLDQAYVNISQISELGNDQQPYLYLRSENCYKCPFRPYEEFFPEDKEVKLYIYRYTYIYIYIYVLII